MWIKGSNNENEFGSDANNSCESTPPPSSANENPYYVDHQQTHVEILATHMQLNTMNYSLSMLCSMRILPFIIPIYKKLLHIIWKTFSLTRGFNTYLQPVLLLLLLLAVFFLSVSNYQSVTKWIENGHIMWRNSLSIDSYYRFSIDEQSFDLRTWFGVETLWHYAFIWQQHRIAHIYFIHAFLWFKFFWKILQHRNRDSFELK